ncbi:MAG: hypothetical protein FWD87_05155 [Spirochaetaceae bacterium]|nr:hypothetical protein [Spirochaetaceae bacterium]
MKDDLYDFIKSSTDRCIKFGVLNEVLYHALVSLSKGDDGKLKQALSDAMHEWDV